MTSAWIRHPTVHGDAVVFVADDDLWVGSLRGGTASRLTTGKGAAARPRLSPDGTLVAFDGAEEGVRDVYVVPTEGGPLTRLTWHGDGAQVLGWSPAGQVVYATAWQQPFVRWTVAHEISPGGGPATPLPFGPLAGLAWGPEDRVMLARHANDLAWWKGYRGGRMGVLWLREPGVTPGPGTWRKLELPFAAAHPTRCGSRWFFVGDPGGVPQLCSVDVSGGDLRVHTSFPDLAVRFPSSDGATVVFTHGGDLYAADAEGAVRRVEVTVRSQRAELQRRLVGAHRFLESVDFTTDCAGVLLTARGRVASMGFWEGPVRPVGSRDSAVRQRLARTTREDEVLLVSDRSGEDRFELWRGSTEVRSFGDLTHGRPVEVEVDPKGERAAFSDHTGALWLLDLRDGAARRLDHAPGARRLSPDWSSDGRWLAWARPEDAFGRARIRLLDTTADGAAPIDATDGRYVDFAPSFDPEGGHLWFLSAREFDPVADALMFDYGFPRAIRPYAVVLGADLPHPFLPQPRPLKPEKHKPSAEAPATKVDLDGLQDRVVAFPVPEGRYQQIVGVPGGVILVRGAVRGTLDRSMHDQGPPKAEAQLLLWDRDKHELVEILPRVSGVAVDRTRATLAIRSGWKLRVAQARLEKGTREELKKSDAGFGRKSGWIDLDRVKLSVEPGFEWRQMLAETWRLMRDHFWDPGLGGVDWPAVLERYRGLLPRLATRGELSDLLWCLQGELGTSHAYEMGGDYLAPPTWSVGRLGADLAWDAAAAGWRVERIVRGEPGTTRTSPLLTPGARISEGEVVLAVAGAPVRLDRPPEADLVGQANTPVELTVRDRAGAVRSVVVRTTGDDRDLRYRDWVLSRRDRVRAASGGRLGYVHVPDMGPGGFAEFHRDVGVECELPGLVVDVRFNRGGHVSQLLLSKLAQRRVGWKVARWGPPYPYPSLSPAGPMVCVTNEMSGSDGDIFSHAWKRLGLGPLVGTRTWGGVVGISPRHLLVDRAMVTQPEYATWFDDVGYGLENHGAVPDVVVDVPPAAFGPVSPRAAVPAGAEDDPQLDHAVRWLLAELDRRPSPAVPPPPG